MSDTNYISDHSTQVWQGIDDKFPKKVHNATSTSDGLLSAEDKAKLDKIDVNDYNSRVYDVASWESDGLMATDDKIKLDGIETNANNYIHPNNENIRHVTDAQISAWDAKAETSTVTNTQNGLMSTVDKIKLDGIETNANNYVHPDTHPATMIVENSTHRFVTDVEKEFWSNKAENILSTKDKDGLMTSADKAKLDTIEEGANKYIHPNNEGVRHVTDAEKEYWNSKANKSLATNSENGLMAAKDKIKLDGIEAGANNYVHPDDPTHRHVTDEQIKSWNSRGGSIASELNNGLMSKEDKIKLDKMSPEDIYKLQEDCLYILDRLKEAVFYEDLDESYARKTDDSIVTVIYCDSIPTTGEHQKNEIAYSNKPAETGCLGWVCIESGEPGKWQPFAKF